MPSEHRKTPWWLLLWRLLWMTIGTFLVALALEQFLIPHRMIDGGVVGIAIIVSHLSHTPLGFWTLLLNIPFLYLGYREIGKTFVFSTLYSISFLSVWVTILAHWPPLVDSYFLATVFGGLILGIGVGLILRNGGSLDGTEIVSLVLSERLDFSVGEIVMFFNVFIFSAAAIFFSLESAMYSVIVYYIAYRVIDLVLQGLDEMKSVVIISSQAKPIAEAIMARLGRGVTHLYGRGGYSGEDKEILFVIVTRLEISKLRSIIEAFDPQAFVTIENVHDVMGGRFNKRSIH